jgi:hypothetical protein
MPENMTRTHPPRVFGVFNPIGHVVIAFATDADATQARAALLTGGYEADEMLQFRRDEVIADAELGGKLPRELIDVMSLVVHTRQYTMSRGAIPSFPRLGSPDHRAPWCHWGGWRRGRCDR